MDANLKTDLSFIAGYLGAALEVAEFQRNGLAAETLRGAIHQVLQNIYEARPEIAGSKVGGEKRNGEAK